MNFSYLTNQIFDILSLFQVFMIYLKIENYGTLRKRYTFKSKGNCHTLVYTVCADGFLADRPLAGRCTALIINVYTDKNGTGRSGNISANKKDDYH